MKAGGVPLHAVAEGPLEAGESLDASGQKAWSHRMDRRIAEPIRPTML